MLGRAMNQPSRLALLLILFALLAGIGFTVGLNPSPTNSTASAVIFTGLVMASFVALLMEHWFTKPTDAIATAIAILLVIVPSWNSLAEMGAVLIGLAGYTAGILVLASVAILLMSGEPSEKRQKAGKLLSGLSTYLGSGKFMFLALFLGALFTYVDRESPHFIVLSIYAAAVLAVDPKKLPSLVFPRKTFDPPIGEVIGVQSRNTILAKLAANRVAVSRYDFVEFSDAGDSNRRRKGLIIDNWVLNSEQWIKVFCGSLVSKTIGDREYTSDLKPGMVYKIDPDNKGEILNKFVGTVYEGSEILSIKFDYGMKVPVREGTLLEIEIDKKSVMYQVTQGVTRAERLDAKNQAGLIIGQAAQIGIWNSEDLKFDRFGWVPEINKPVLIAADIAPVDPPDGEMKIGNIPGTQYPIFMSKLTAVNCHMAVIGVTGTGKSVFSRHLMRSFANDGMKVIVVDFTGEYKAKLAHEDPHEVIARLEERMIFDNIDWLAAESVKYPDKRDISEIARLEREVQRAFAWAIFRFLYCDKHLAIFELPDVSNSNAILSYTRWFFKVLFQLAKDKRLEGCQFCVVLEEAHTVVPEWNFLSTDDKGAQALLNQISQIALQGRKYGIGFLVIAQRTANVSKTVLTQCNTLIVFQQFDRTSAEFLSNYMGPEMTQALQNLPPRKAVAVGKAFRSGLPTIFEVPEIIEP
jgi:uncharacterized protein